MPGSAGQGLRDRRRRTAALLSRSIKEAARAPVGVATAEVKRSAAQSSPVAPEAKPVPVVQAERVPDQEPGCIKQLGGCGLARAADAAAGRATCGQKPDRVPVYHWCGLE